MPFTKKESLPDRQQGVRETSSVRRKVMAAPRCPKVDDPEKKGYDGEPNCQNETQSAPGWWKLCEERGHDPYYSVDRKITKEPIVGEDGIITAYREKVIEKRRLNTVTVPIGTRFHSGRGEQITRGLKGRRSLTEMGFKEKCEYRNCELDAKLNTKYGEFCGERHARLIGGDVEGMLLPVTRLGRINNEGNKMLKTLDLDFEGAHVIQMPPDIENAQ